MQHALEPRITEPMHQMLRCRLPFGRSFHHPAQPGFLQRFHQLIVSYLFIEPFTILDHDLQLAYLILEGPFFQPSRPQSII